MAMATKVFVVTLLALVACSTASAAAQGVDYCATCEQLVGALQQDGSGDACKYIGAVSPPESTVCDWIVDHLADYILKKVAAGFNATNICKVIGMCSAQGCPCGECQSPQFSLRCLSLPNKCPSTNSPLLLSGATASPTPDRAAAAAAAAQDLQGVPPAVAGMLRGVLRGLNGAASAASDPGFCFDGTCDSSHVGCCLTCF